METKGSNSSMLFSTSGAITGIVYCFGHCTSRKMSTKLEKAQPQATKIIRSLENMMSRKHDVVMKKMR